LLVRLIGIRFTHLVSGHYQINLFDDTEQQLNLYKALDTIRNRYGDRSVIRAAAMGSSTIGRMHNPFDGQPPVVLAHRKQ
jgi:DNA polymerase-4